MTAATDAASARPLTVRVLRVTAWLALAAGLLALGIGALLGFDELAKIWAVIAGLALVTATTAFLGTRPSRVGLACALVACALLLILPPGFLLVLVIGMLASQDRARLAAYYGLRGRAV